ncbi:MAG TPA: hypothetical protein VMB66_00730 [Candidatus Acidoferrales bacterium]|nr:hypothetical protein [Candidatus Acidoferrales bacterium]
MVTQQPKNKRIFLAIAIFVSCCLLSTIRIIGNAPRPAQLQPDTVAKRSDQRFASLKAALPAHGVIGYIGESGVAGTADYYLAQYALAPLVVDTSDDHPLVIGNFPDRPNPPSPLDLKLIRNFGDGLLLFSNEKAK